MKKLIVIGAVIGTLTLGMIGGGLWASYQAYQYIVTHVQLPQNVKVELNEKCWMQAQSLLDPFVWINKAPAENTHKLISACTVTPTNGPTEVPTKTEESTSNPS